MKTYKKPEHENPKYKSWAKSQGLDYTNRENLDTFNQLYIRNTEMTNKIQQQLDRSTMRLNNIIDKYYDDPSMITRKANLRTDRITNVMKLKSWIDVLENENFYSAAEYGYEKLSTFTNHS